MKAMVNLWVKKVHNIKKNARFNFSTGKNVNTSAPTKLNYFPNQSFKNHKIYTKKKTMFQGISGQILELFLRLFLPRIFCDSYTLEEPVFD